MAGEDGRRRFYVFFARYSLDAFYYVEIFGVKEALP
jgi:hypothetical protein